MDDDDITANPRSQLAAALERLKRASFNAADTRERLPQPMFWSLFRSQIDEAKKVKAKTRALEELFGPK